MKGKRDEMPTGRFWRNRSRRWRIAVCAAVALGVLAGAALVPRLPPLISTGGQAGTDVLLLDPGHGGMDGGASGASGVCEKDINLAIALYIRELAEADGWQVVMTREEDKGLYSGVKNDGTEEMEIEGKRSIRSLKTEDLKARRDLVERISPTAAVSIHLNSFKEDASVHGAQTFYPSGKEDDAVIAESKRLAETVQKRLVEGIDDGTDRVALEKRDVLLFKSPSAPIIIVECGFLSNRSEEERLQSEEYQKKLAECIYGGVMDYSGKEIRKPLTTVDSRG